jgi:SAM-dependent methyltransferase
LQLPCDRWEHQCIGADYAPEPYWEGLLSADYSEAGIGYANLALGINLALFRSLRFAVARALGPACPPGRVLDVGSGTGIWIEFWRGRGATDITGIDITETAVERLGGRFPGLRFARADVSASVLPVDGPFDTISAMSVLLHITDDSRYQRAIENLTQRLAPGGTLVLIEPAIAHRWWGPPFGPDASSKARPLSELVSSLESAGVAVEAIRPATVVLSNPVDTRTRLGWRALTFGWDQLTARVGRDEHRGAAAGRMLGLLDRGLLRVVPRGPSAKVIVARGRSSLA